MLLALGSRGEVLGTSWELTTFPFRGVGSALHSSRAEQHGSSRSCLHAFKRVYGTIDMVKILVVLGSECYITINRR